VSPKAGDYSSLVKPDLPYYSLSFKERVGVRMGFSPSPSRRGWVALALHRTHPLPAALSKAERTSNLL
jgi:hypothetical protein